MGKKPKMKRRKGIILIVAISLLALGAAYLYLTLHGSEKSPEKMNQDESKVASVRVAIIKRESIKESITAYGISVPAPGTVQSVSVPFESIVRHILVSEGQRISLDAALIEIEPSPDTSLKIQEARRAYESARQSLHKIQQRFDLKLATTEELLAAKHRFQQAKLRLLNLQQRGIEARKKIRSSCSGVIYKVPVHTGSIVASGSPLVEIAPEDRIEVRLGVEQEDVKRLNLGQKVLLTSVNSLEPSDVTGEIQTISHSVDPATRLVNIFVAIQSPDKFLLGEYVRGEIIIASRSTLVVPRNAVLPEDGHYVLFTIKNRHAHKQIISVGLENHKRVEVISENLKPGDRVVILGNYELRDGMAVRVGMRK